MIYIKRFILMIQFFTTIPLQVSLKVDNRDFGKGLVFAPFIGLIIGVVLAGAYYCLALIFTKVILAALTFIIYIVLSGGLHLDGLGDTFDGLFSNRSKERILEIMRDSRVGTNAVLAVLSIFILNITLLSEFTRSQIIGALLLMPVAGRIGSLVGAGISKYARAGEGLGKSFIDFCGLREIFIGLVIYFGIFYFILSLKGIIIAIVPVVSAIFFAKVFGRKIGGVTGDILGAICELNQTVFLIVFYIVTKYL